MNATPSATVHSLDGRERPATQPRSTPKAKDTDVVAEAKRIGKKFQSAISDGEDLYEKMNPVDALVENILATTISYVFEFAKAYDLLPEEYKAVAATV